MPPKFNMFNGHARRTNSKPDEFNKPLFVQGHHVGGNDATQKAAANGKLQKLLDGERKEAEALV